MPGASGGANASRASTHRPRSIALVGLRDARLRLDRCRADRCHPGATASDRAAAAGRRGSAGRRGVGTRSRILLARPCSRPRAAGDDGGGRAARGCRGSSRRHAPSADVMRVHEHRFVQPGNRQPRSRLASARLNAVGTLRVLRPTLSGRPSRSNSGTIAASHASRRAVSAASGAPSRARSGRHRRPASVAASRCRTTW